jgi:hypothetical protein
MTTQIAAANGWNSHETAKHCVIIDIAHNRRLQQPNEYQGCDSSGNVSLILTAALARHLDLHRLSAGGWPKAPVTACLNCWNEISVPFWYKFPSLDRKLSSGLITVHIPKISKHCSWSAGTTQYRFVLGPAGVNRDQTVNYHIINYEIRFVKQLVRRKLVPLR